MIMKYKINESVITLTCKSVKEIIDSEIISDVEIYYMSDKTSYSSEQLLSMDEFVDGCVTPMFDEFEKKFKESLQKLESSNN
jgi:hypothetical protein